MRTRLPRPLLILAAILLLSCLLLAQGQPAPDSGISRQQADQMLQELRQIRHLLERNAAPAPQPAPAPQKARLNVGGMSILGRPDAPLTMIEFSDYQCPFCRAFHNNTFAQIKKDWIDTGKLRFVSWDLPLEFHSNAAKAAQAARCAGEQDKFFELRALLIANAAKLAPEEIVGYAGQLPQLDLGRFKSCFAGDKFSAEIKRSADLANAQGVSGTPTFLIGKSSGDVVEGVLLIGAQPYPAFDRQLKELAK